MLFSCPVRVMLTVLFLFEMSNFCFAEPIMLGSSAGNSVQIKALKRRGKTVFEIQLGGGSNQPPANTRITGKASAVFGRKKYSGYYRLSTGPARQLQMKLKTADNGNDMYSFITGYDVLSFEFAPTSSFTNSWLTGQITNVSATQRAASNGNQNNGNQNNGNQNNGNKNNGNKNNGNKNNGNQHPPISLIGKISAPRGGSLARLFGSGRIRLVLNIGGNQRLSVVTPGNSLSGMKLEHGSYYSPKRK